MVSRRLTVAESFLNARVLHARTLVSTISVWLIVSWCSCASGQESDEPMVSILVSKRVALVVGNTKYDQAPLATLAQDARTVAESLRALGFEVTTRFDRSKAELESDIDQITDGLGPADVVLFYFAGHGIQAKQRNYLVPVMPNATRELPVRRQCVALDYVFAALDYNEVGVKIVLLDACRPNPFVDSRTGKKVDGLASVVAPRRTIIAMACGVDEVIADDQASSPFTQQLVASLQSQPADKLDIRSAFSSMAETVQTKTGSRPFVTSDADVDRFWLDPKRIVVNSTASENLAAPVADPMAEPIGGNPEPQQKPPTAKYLAPMAVTPVKPLDKTPLVSNPLPTMTRPQQLAPPPASVEHPMGIKFKLIPAGSFLMGSPDNEESRGDDESQHRVTISKPFYMSAHEITIGQFKKFVDATGRRTLAERIGYGFRGVHPRGKVSFLRIPGQSWRNPGYPVTDDHPVVQVSWEDAKAFTYWLSTLDRRYEYRLPTEAEWEYAARAGSTTKFATGNRFQSLQGHANVPQSERFDSFSDSSPVGSFRPNSFGLHDMHGNVWEWCLDTYDDKFYQSGISTNPISERITNLRVFRGGCYM